jgi:enoyl-CoA hydratase/carnithine racemase
MDALNRQVPVWTTLRIEVNDRIARVTLNRPEKLNALSRQLMSEIVELGAWLKLREDIRVVILSGSGRSFSAGFDLNDFSSASAGESPRIAADLGRLATNALTDVPQLTIAAVHGHCVGGGVVFVAACDLRVATTEATFTIPEVDLGIPLAWGGIPRLVREIGPALTKELVLTCRPFDAAEAKSIGFINRVVDPEDLDTTVNELAENLASKTLYSLHSTKQQVNAVMEEIAGTGRSAGDADMLVYAMRDPESREATARYLAQRK